MGPLNGVCFIHGFVCCLAQGLVVKVVDDDGWLLLLWWW
jgi:hypothetical protein